MKNIKRFHEHGLICQILNFLTRILIVLQKTKRDELGVDSVEILVARTRSAELDS